VLLLFHDVTADVSGFSGSDDANHRKMQLMVAAVRRRVFSPD
jgi:hypothetical protein